MICGGLWGCGSGWGGGGLFMVFRNFGVVRDEGAGAALLPRGGRSSSS